MTAEQHFSVTQGETFARTVTWKTKDAVADPERSVSDAVTNATTTVTSATASFVVGDVQREVSGTNIPSGAYIVSRTNSTTIVISVAATASGTALPLTVLSTRRVDVTGYTSGLMVRRSKEHPDTLVALTQSAGITLGTTAGTAAIVITGAVTAALPTGRHTYDLKLVSGSSVTKYLIGGTFEVRKQVTT
jgi:hypothetical protein